LELHRLLNHVTFTLYNSQTRVWRYLFERWC